VYGNFGVIGELKEGGAVGNFALQDKSGNLLDLSGFGKSFGDFFKQDEGSEAAFNKVSDLKPGDYAALGGQFAKETVSAMGFFELSKMDPTALSAMMKEAGGPTGPGGAAGPGGLELKPEQWAGALGAMNPKDIAGLGNNVVGNAVGSLGSKDFLAIPPDQVLAMMQSTVLKSDPQAGGGAQPNLGQYSGKLDGMLGALGADQYKQIDPGAMLGMMQAMNLGGQGFDLSKTALQGKDVANMFGALDQQRLGEFGGEKLLGSINDLQKGDFVDLDAKGAFNIYKTLGAEGPNLGNLAGIAGRFDADTYKEMGNKDTFDIVKALEKGDFKALDALGANGACPILDHSQLGELGAPALASMITGVGAGASDLPKEHIQTYLQGFKAGDVGTLDQGVAGNLVGAAADADLSNLAPDVQNAYLQNLGAGILGAAGFGAAGGPGDTVFNIVPAGAYLGGSLAQVIAAAGGPLFGGNLFGGGSP
jgi:hypothetical protein